MELLLVVGEIHEVAMKQVSHLTEILAFRV